MSIAVLELLLIALLAGEPALELPNLIITGQFSAEKPERTYWPMPDELATEWVEGLDMAMPASSRRTAESHYVPTHTAIPAGFSFALAGGPRRSGNLIAAIAEPGGGVSVRGWSSSGEKMERAGIRGSAMTGGSWGSIGVRLERWRDLYDDGELAPDWLCGDIFMTLPLRRGHDAALTAYSTSAEDDDIHVRVRYHGALTSLSNFTILAGDREAEGLVSWRLPSGALRLQGGGAWVRSNEDDTTWLTGDGSLLFASLGRGSVRISGARSLVLERREWLRNQFPLLGEEQEAMLAALEWEGRIEGRYRLAPNVEMALVAGSRSYKVAPAWRQGPDGVWEAVSLGGEGPFGSLSGRWIFDAGYEVRGILSTDVVESNAENTDRSTNRWPVRPRTTWTLEMRRHGSLDLRCRLIGKHGMVTYEGLSIPAEILISWQALVPLGVGWQVWTTGSLGDSWEYSPTPNRMVTVGMSWSSRGLLK